MNTRIFALTAPALACLAFASPASAQSTAFTYQGHVRASGNAFTGAGQFKFALVTSTNASRQATATGTISGAFLTIVNVTDGGQGYIDPPSVTAEGGGGSGAVLTANISGGVVVSINVNNPGSGYVSPPAIVITPPSEAIFYTTYWSNDGSSVNGSEPSAPVAVPVSNGLFSVLLGSSALANMQEIGASVFDQTNLQLRIWFNDGVNGFSVLNPAQPLTATPYAIRARLAGGITGTLNSNNIAAGAVASAQILDGSVTGNDIADNSIGVADINVTNFNTTFWRSAGNRGTTAGTHFLGTVDNQAVEFKANNARVLRLEPRATSPNVIGGHAANFFSDSTFGSTIGGGGAAGMSNQILAVGYSTIGGGVGNSILDGHSTIGGGKSNMVQFQGEYSAIAGGLQNFAMGGSSAIGGGTRNSIRLNSSHGTIGGGEENNIQPDAVGATIGGGTNNNIQLGATSAVIGGGSRNTVRALSPASTIAGGDFNVIGTNSRQSVISGGASNIVADNSVFSTIAGGKLNDIGTNSTASVISGGYDNSIGTNSDASTIGGGEVNRIAVNAQHGTIAGGRANGIGTNSDFSVVGGGVNNDIAANSGEATIAGGSNNDIGTNSVQSVIGGGGVNTIAANSSAATIAGGVSNDISTNSDYSTIGGGRSNDIAADSQDATIAGGIFNSIGTNSGSSVVGGGEDNDIAANSESATIVGGRSNGIGPNSNCSTIGGGSNNNVKANSPFAMIPGGENNAATNYAFAAGHRAKANHMGAFVWADSQNSDFPSTVNDEASFRCQGGVRFSSGAGGANQQVAWMPGSGAWSFTSDRETKEALVPVEGRAVLERVARLPISEWNYKGYAQRHIGPMAQDFHAAFPLNTNDTALNTADLHGVALAAIQGLNQKVEEQRAELKTKGSQIEHLQQTVAELKDLLRKLAERPARAE